MFAILLSNNSRNRLRLRHQPAAVPLLKLTGETCMLSCTHAHTQFQKCGKISLITVLVTSMDRNAGFLHVDVISCRWCKIVILKVRLMFGCDARVSSGGRCRSRKALVCWSGVPHTPAVGAAGIHTVPVTAPLFSPSRPQRKASGEMGGGFINN